MLIPNYVSIIYFTHFITNLHCSIPLGKVSCNIMFVSKYTVRIYCIKSFCKVINLIYFSGLVASAQYLHKTKEKKDQMKQDLKSQVISQILKIYQINTFISNTCDISCYNFRQGRAYETFEEIIKKSNRNLGIMLMPNRFAHILITINN